MFDLSEGERDASLSELQPPPDLVQFARGYRVQPVVPALATEDQQLSGEHVDISHGTVGTLEVHAGAASEREADEDFFEGRVRVHVRRNSLAGRVVVDRQLVEHAEGVEQVLLGGLELSRMHELRGERSDRLGLPVLLSPFERRQHFLDSYR